MQSETAQGRVSSRERSGDSITLAKEKHHLSPAVFALESPEPISKGKKIFSRVNKLFKSPRKHHRKLSESRSEEGASSDNLEELERSSETPLGTQTRQADLQPRHFSPEPTRRRMTSTLPAGVQLGASSLGKDSDSNPMVNVESEPILPIPHAKPEASPGTPQHRSEGESGSGKWDKAAIDVEATQDLINALLEKMGTLDSNIQSELGEGASTLKDLLTTLECTDLTEKSRLNARKTFERGNRSRSKKLLQLQTKLEQLMQVTIEVQKNGVPKGRDPEEFVKSLMRTLAGPSAKTKRKGMLDTVKQVGHRLEDAVDNMKDAAGSLGRSLKRPGRSNSMDNLISHTLKDTHSDDGEVSSFAGGSSTLPRVSAPGATTQSNSDPSEHHTGTGASVPPPGNISAIGSRPSGGPETTKTASSSGGGLGAGQSVGMANGGATTGGADTGSSRERRSTSECSQSNSSLREEVNLLRGLVDDMRQQMENNNYAVEVNRRDLFRHVDFYRMGLEEVNSKMERLEELFNESINSLKEEISALGEQLEYRFIDRHRNLRDNVESLRNQQSQIERRYEQQFRTLGSLDTGEAYAPSLLKTRLLDLVIAIFNLLVFLLSAVVQLSIRLANIGSLLQRRPLIVVGIAGLLFLLLLGLLTGELDVWTKVGLAQNPSKS